MEPHIWPLLSVRIAMAGSEAIARTTYTMGTCSAPIFDCPVRLSGLARATYISESAER